MNTQVRAHKFPAAPKKIGRMSRRDVSFETNEWDDSRLVASYARGRNPKIIVEVCWMYREHFTGPNGSRYYSTCKKPTTTITVLSYLNSTNRVDSVLSFKEWKDVHLVEGLEIAVETALAHVDSIIDEKIIDARKKLDDVLAVKYHIHFDLQS